MSFSTPCCTCAYYVAHAIANDGTCYLISEHPCATLAEGPPCSNWKLKEQ